MSQIDDFLDGKPATPAAPKVSAIDAFLGEDKPKEPGLARGAADTAIAGATGLVSGVQMLSNVAGADNPVSRGLGKANEFLADLESPYRKAEKQERAKKIKAAEESGSTWEEVKAYAGAFGEAPLDTTVNALGTSVPTLAAAFLTGGASVPAQVAARALPLAIGGAQGAGAVKGQIYEAVEQEHLKAGKTPEEAAALAAKAQAYDGKNAGQIALGTGLGALAGSTGAESAVRRLVGGAVAKEAGKEAAMGIGKAAGLGVLKETPVEMLQGGQERVASNLALQNEGFDTPTWQGVAGQAALEGLASAPMGAGFGMLDARGLPTVNPNTAVEPPAQPPTPQPPSYDANALQALQQTRLDALASEEAGNPDVPQAPAPDGAAALAAQTERANRARQAMIDLSRATESPDDEILQSTGMVEPPMRPSVSMGIDPNAGAISRVAAEAVDGPASMEMAVRQAERDMAALAAEDNPEAGADPLTAAPDPLIAQVAGYVGEMGTASPQMVAAKFGVTTQRAAELLAQADPTVDDLFPPPQGAANVSNIDAAGALAAGVGGPVGVDAAGGQPNAGLLGFDGGGDGRGSAGSPSPVAAKGGAAPVSGSDGNQTLTPKQQKKLEKDIIEGVTVGIEFGYGIKQIAKGVRAFPGWMTPEQREDAVRRITQRMGLNVPESRGRKERMEDPDAQGGWTATPTTQVAPAAPAGNALSATEDKKPKNLKELIALNKSRKQDDTLPRVDFPTGKDSQADIRAQQLRNYADDIGVTADIYALLQEGKDAKSIVKELGRRLDGINWPERDIFVMNVGRTLGIPFKKATANVQDQPQGAAAAAPTQAQPEAQQAAPAVGGDGAAQPGAAPAGNTGVEAAGVSAPALAKREDGTLKNKSEYTADEWSAYTKSVIDAKLGAPAPTPSPTTTEPTDAPRSPEAAQAVETTPQGREETALLSDSVKPAGKYQLPEGRVSDSWRDSKKRGTDHPDYEPTPRQQVLMDEVAKAKDAGAFYANDVKDAVAKALGVDAETLAANTTGVEGGDFGMDVYLAGRALDAKRKNAREREIAKELSLKPGDKLGTLVFNDMKVTNSVEVESVSDDGLSFNFKGKRGPVGVKFSTGPVNVKGAIERAHEKGKRKDTYEQFIEGRNAPAVAAPAPATETDSQEPSGITKAIQNAKRLLRETRNKMETEPAQTAARRAELKAREDSLEREIRRLRQQAVADEPVAAPAPAPAPNADGSTIVGRRKDGVMIRKDKNGVRFYTDGGVRVSETVELRPTRQGMQMAKGELKPDFMTAEEAEGVKAEKTPAPAAPKPAPAPAPVAAKDDALAEREKAAKAKMLNAAAKLANLLSKNTRANITPEQEQAMLPIAIELFEGAMELGYVKFKQAAKYVRQFIANAIDQDAADSLPVDTLQGAYIAVSRRHKDKAITPKAEVITVDSAEEIDAEPLDDLVVQEDNATPENTNGQPQVRQDGARALGEAPSEEGGGAAGGEPTGAGAADRGQPDAGADSGPAGAGVSPSRGRGSRPRRVSDPAARGERVGGRRGTGRNGAQVPGSDVRAPGAAGAPADAVNDLFGGDAETASAPNIPAANFKIEDDLNLGSGGEAAKFRDNIAAIETLKAIEAERRRATPEEQRILARFVGWGGLASAFPNPETGKFKDGWEQKGEQLRNLLTPSEYRAASRSTRNAHYTSSTVVKAMWSAVRRLGYRNGLALETSMGVGNFLGLKPDDLGARFIGVEYDALTARMAKALYPQATVLQAGFQDVPLPDNVFDLSIGNPPFGDESLRFQYRPELRGESIHNQFFRASMAALKPGGVQSMVVSRYLMDKQDRATRIALAREADLVAAIRLPDTAFKENARTEVVTDIIILRKRDAADKARMDAILDAYIKPKEKDYTKERERRDLAAQAPKWIETAEIADPLGGEPMTVNSYFVANPGQVVGVMERSGSMRYKNDVTVRLDDPGTLAERLDALVAKLPENIVDTAADVEQATERNYQLLGEALSMAVAREEAGHIKFNDDGGMTRAVEREFGANMVLTRQPLTANSPWSKQLFLDDQGRWYKQEVKVDAEGKPVKMLGKDGKPTNRNLYERTVYQNEADIPNTLRLGETGFARLKGLVGLRDLLKRQLVLETEDAPKVMMEGNRKKLAAAYDAFVAEHGPINRRANAALVSEMPDGGLILALEEGYEPERTAAQAKKSGLPEQKESAKPAPIMRERVVPKYEPPTQAETPADALAINLAERGVVDIERIAKLLNITPEEAEAQLQEGDKPLIFKDPETGNYETANAYLSGHVRRKLNAARAAGLQKNVAALEAIQPERWGAENVTVQIGSSWVPADVYADFGKHLFGGDVKVSFSPLTNTFQVSANGNDQTKAENWSSEGAPGAWILGRLLNSQSPVVTGVDADGKTYVDKERTSLAILKSREMVAEFGDWVFKDSGRRERLVEIFNEKFNTRVTRQFDGSHLKLPGKVPDSIIKMRRHQMNAIWRGISSRFLLIDHVVGAGKTFTAIARAMERRRMGLAQKPAIVVPNHLIEQWQADVYRLYPGAKVLAATKADFEAKNRRKLFSRIATGDYDIVILPHSSLVKIGISPETEQRYLEAELQEAIQAVKDAQEQAEDDGYTGFRKPMGVKEAERLVAKIEARMAKLREGATDRLLTFEQLGIDDLTVDEAHEFKNLFYSSRMTGTRGMGDKTGSLKASDLYNKVRVLRDNGGSVVFMTGTPVSNSVVELYTMMRYLAATDLRDMGMEHFDAWRAQFVEATPAFEPDESNRLKEVTRLGRTWSNMRSMMDLYYQFTDAVSIDDIKQWYAEDNQGKAFPVPKVKGGDRALVKVQPTQAQDAMLKDVIAGFDSLDGIKDPKERNAERLRLMDRARKLSLDARAADRMTTSNEKGGKLEKLSAEVKRIYDKWTPDRGTQLVFLDRSVPKAKGDDKIIKEYDAIMAKRDKALADGDDVAFQEQNDALEKFDANEIEALRNAQNGGWNAYQQIKDNLVASGIPADEIRFIQEANTDEQKQALFDAVNGGKVRVLIGSTPRMGAGTNVQKRLVALHHADVTWKPSDIEQREGRIIRQGNDLLTQYGDNFEVEILAYATERTVDAKMWSLNATKLRAINGLRKYTGDFTMEVEDEESVSMAEMAALASGNPLLLERVTLESAINGLELQERAFRRKMYGAEDALRDANEVIRTYPGRIEQSLAQAKDMATRVRAVADAADARRVTVEGQEYATFKDALKAVKAAVDEQQAGNENARYAVNINGERVTNKAAIEDAIGKALGDAEAFEVDLGGTTFTQRTAAGREVAARLSPLAAQKTGQGTLGSMFGFKLSYEFSPNRFESNKVDLVLVLEDANGKTMASADVAGHDPNIQFTTSKMRDLVGELASQIEDKATGNNADHMQRRLERARRDLPTLQERVKETFPKAQELKDKRARLQEVVTMLTTGIQQAEPDVSTNLAQTGDLAANTTDVVFSRSNAAKQGITNQAAEQIVGVITSRWANAPEVVVVESVQDSKVPAAVRRADAAQRSQGATGQPEGFWYGGKAYIVSGALNRPVDVVRVLFHEVLGHYGLRGTFGADLKPILAQIATMRKSEVQAKATEYGLDMAIEADRLQAAEEVLAVMAQSNPQAGFVKRAIGAIRAWLRENIPGLENMRLTDNDIVTQFILPARRFVQQGPAARVGDGVLAMSRSAGDVTDTPAFRKWFGDSKVVDADGKPLVVYHGTSEDFSEFKGDNFFFAESPSYAQLFSEDGRGSDAPRTIPVYLSMKKPIDLSGLGADRVTAGAVADILESNGVQIDRVGDQGVKEMPWVFLQSPYVRNQIKAAGYDGIIQKEPHWKTRDPMRVYVAFRPEQIKSAIGNNGQFDPENPDIRFSRSPRELAGMATDQLKMTLTAPGKLSWWHKSVGTMYNLAERHPAFKPVFNAAQSFIDDVSYYATDAADLAPKMLPKLESWKDIAKSPISAEDNKAIEAPINEGTLLWARDESGRPVKVAELEAQAADMTADQKARRLLRNDKINEGVLRMWQGLPQEQYEKLIESRYQSQMLTPGVVWTDAELKAIWKLNDAQIGLYREVRAAIDKSLDNLAKSDLVRFVGKDGVGIKDAIMEAGSVDEAALMARDYFIGLSEAEPDRAEMLLATANGIMDRADKVERLKEQGYAPLSRFGKYTVDVVTEEGRQYFGLFESMREANQMAARMRGEFGKDAVSQGTLSDESFKLFQGITPETLELFGNMLGLSDTGDTPQDQAFQAYLKLTKNNRSAMKRLIQRKGILGYSQDVGRVLANFIYSNARQTAGALHIGDLTEAVNAIPQSQGELKDEAVRLAEYIQNPQEEAQAFRGLLFAQYLGGSIASAMVNMTQPLQVSLPYLSQFGGVGAAGKELMRAIKGIATGKKDYEPDLARALKHAEEDGTVSPQEVHQLMAQARGAGTLRSGDGTKLGDALAKGGNAWAKMSLAWGKVFGVAEQMNRRSTFIAAYRLAKAQKMADPAGFAKKAVHETQFIYSKANKMRWGRGAIGGVAMTFKTYGIAYLELLHRMATQGGPEGKRAAMLAVAVLLVMGGAGGLPFMEDAEDITDAIAQVMGYNFSTKQAKQELLQDLFGEAAGQFIERGVSGLPGVPLDVTGRLGMGNLIPGTGMFLQKNSNTRDVLEIAGPAGDLAQRVMNAGGMAVRGNLAGAALELSPKAIRDLAKGADMANTGMYRDAKGFKVIDTTAGEAGLKAIGFQPNTVAQVQESNYLMQRQKDYYNATAQSIRAKWARGLFEKDEAMVAEAREAINAWNEKNPDQRMSPNMPAIWKRVREMAKDKDQRIADTAPKAMRQQFREETARVREAL